MGQLDIFAELGVASRCINGENNSVELLVSILLRHRGVCEQKRVVVENQKAGVVLKFINHFNVCISSRKRIKLIQHLEWVVVDIL